jgi:hypothetical protein
MKKPKYNLTFLQKIELFFLWFYWKITISDVKKSWHEVKKGMEKHTCNYTKSDKIRGYIVYVCDHEGCYKCDFTEQKPL